MAAFGTFAMYDDTQLRQILDLSPQHVGILGPDGQPLYANRAALDYFGVDIEQWRDARTRLHLVHPIDRERFVHERQRACLIAGRREFEARLLGRDGVFRWHVFRLNPISNEQGSVRQWYGTAIDAELRKQTEGRLERMVVRDDIDEASMRDGIIGTSQALRPMLDRVAKVAHTDTTVLVTGETGTGKELVARAIHRRSRRASQPFVAVNCAAIPRDLIPSELFGHEKGAFTGASRRHPGRFEMAHGGTIFLDEVGELPAETQLALLRVLQERQFERLGGGEPCRVDVRVIAATNRDLLAAIDAGTFRHDLFYRLHVFPITVPPLRDRADDIPLLAQHFIDRYARQSNKRFRRIHWRTLDHLRSYPWPGNVRELQSVIERSVIACDTDEFVVDEEWRCTRPAIESRVTLSGARAAHERAMIEEALQATGARVFGPSGAAERLGIPRSTLESRIRALKIDKRRFRGR